MIQCSHLYDPPESMGNTEKKHCPICRMRMCEFISHHTEKIDAV